jgi:hypothetical protein
MRLTHPRGPVHMTYFLGWGYEQLPAFRIHGATR